MKKLGEGWQYSVYDIGNGRVLKKRNSSLRSFIVILKEMLTGKERFKLYKIAHYVERSNVRAKYSLELLRATSFPSDLMGNPKFLADLNYEQDKLVSVGDSLKDNLNEGFEIIDEYILLLKSMISYGFIEESFNLGDNFGISKDNRVVLMDLGELIASSNINKRILERPWTKMKVLQSVPARYSNYYIEKMDENFVAHGIPLKKKDIEHQV